MSSRPTAVIVIFGAAVRPDGTPSRTLRHRVEAAVQYGSGLNQPVFMPTGAVGRYGASEASVMARLLRASGVQGDRIVLEETGTDTVSSVRAVRRLMRDRPAGTPVFAATSGYHLLRCVLLLRLAGLPARSAPPPSFPAARLWRTRWYWRLREAAALPYDVLLMLGLRLTGRV